MPRRTALCPWCKKGRSSSGVPWTEWTILEPSSPRHPLGPPNGLTPKILVGIDIKKLAACHHHIPIPVIPSVQTSPESAGFFSQLHRPKAAWSKKYTSVKSWTQVGVLRGEIEECPPRTSTQMTNDGISSWKFKKSSMAVAQKPVPAWPTPKWLGSMDVPRKFYRCGGIAFDPSQSAHGDPKRNPPPWPLPMPRGCVAVLEAAPQLDDKGAPGQ